MSKVDEKAAELSDLLKSELGEIELSVLTRPMTLGDLMREGSRVTEHEKQGWGNGDKACALHAAVIAARAHGAL